VVVIERSYHEILQIAIWANIIRLANRIRRARLTTTGRAILTLMRLSHKRLPPRPVTTTAGRPVIRPHRRRR